MKTVLIMAVLASVQVVLAEELKTLVQPFSKQWVVNEIVEFEPIAGHHFSDEAPQKCGDLAPIEKSLNKIACQVSDPGKLKLTLNVCDNEKTFCKTETHSIKVTAPMGYNPSKVKKGVRYVHFIPKGERPAPRGFMLNRPSRAQATAKRKNTILFIEFFGHWCPPCNMLNENVFSKKEFEKNSRGVVKIKMDADSDLSWEWKEHFRVGGYPTMIAADHNLNEIGRIVGYREMGPLLAWIKSMRSLKDQPVHAAIDKLNKGEIKDESKRLATALRIAQWYFDRAEFKKAKDFLKARKLEEKNDDFKLLSRMSDLKLATTDAQKLLALTSLIENHASSVEVGGWLRTALDINPDIFKGKEESLASTINEFQKWSVSESIGDSGYTQGDIHYQLAKIHELSGDSKSAKAEFVRCADAFGVMAKASDLKVARGANLERAYCLLKSGNPVASEELYRQMAKSYKGEFAFNYYFASALFDLEKYKEAYGYVNRAVMNSYGDNWLRAVTLKAKVELKMGNKTKAQKTVKRALNKAVLPSSEQIRSHRYLSALRKVIDEENK